MGSEEEIVKIQKIMVAAAVMVALSLGVGGFSDFAAWQEMEISETTNYGDYSDDEYGYQITWEFVFTLEEVELEYGETDSDGDSYDSSQNIDYGEYGVFEKLEKTMPNIEKGGYLVIILIAFVIWRLQEMKSETSEEIRTIVFKQMTNALKVAGIVVVLASLYSQGSSFEDDFDTAFTSEEDGLLGIDCDEAWTNKPKFEWSGTAKYSYDNTDCENSYWNYDTGSGEVDFSRGSGLYLFVCSAILLFWAFQLLSKSQFDSFTVPSVPDVLNQIQEMKPKSPFKENEVDAYKSNNQTVYYQPEISRMAIPEDEED